MKKANVINICIMTDLEGISGIDTIEMIKQGHPQYEYSIQRLTMDINAAVEGAFIGGATKVIVYDGHGGGNNFKQDQLDKRARISSRPIHEELEKAMDAVMFIGAHAMAGTINGFLDHTQDSLKWYNYYVNGRKTGEIGQWGIIAGGYDLPVVMVSGDQAACVEAAQFLGHIECAVVKIGIGRNKASLIDPFKAIKRIKEAATRSISLIGKIKPYKPILPLELKLELYRSDYCDEIARKNHIERLDARTLRKVSDNYRDILF